MNLKNTVVAVVILLVGVGGYFFLSKRGAKAPERAQDAYKFTALGSGVAAQVSLKNPQLNGNKDISISFQEVLDEHYKSLLGKKNELLFLAGYEQFVKPKLASVKRVSFKLEKPKRPLAEVCSQYGVDCQKIGIIEFNPLQKEFLVLDGEVVGVQQLQQKTVPLLAVKTEILNYILQKVDEIIRTKMLYLISKELQLTAQNFIENKIITAAELTALADKELKRLIPDLPANEKSRHLQWVRDLKKNEATDIYIQKNHLELPILVNVDQPQNDFKTRWEWTPYFGAKPGKAISVVLFVDFFSDASRTAIRNFLRYKAYDYNATFGLRPYFSKNDQLQWVAAEVSMCMWVKQPQVFWTYLEKALTASRDTVEGDLYKAIENAGGNVETIKKCVLSRDMKKVVEYHLQSAEYLKIINPPVVFVGNEVVVGPLGNSDFEKMLLRQPQ